MGSVPFGTALGLRVLRVPAKKISVTLKSMNEPVAVAAGAYVVGKVIAVNIFLHIYVYIFIYICKHMYIDR
jgi:hypothetical protein